MTIIALIGNTTLSGAKSSFCKVWLMCRCCLESPCIRRQGGGAWETFSNRRPGPAFAWHCAGLLPSVGHLKNTASLNITTEDTTVIKSISQQFYKNAPTISVFGGIRHGSTGHNLNNSFKNKNKNNCIKPRLSCSNHSPFLANLKNNPVGCQNESKVLLKV